jgi:dipeptidyl aminopeptidase/acylaminoacyl peptidase
MFRYAARVVLAVSCCWGTVAMRAAPAAPADGALTIERLLDIKHPSSPVWSPDGRRVAFVWERTGVQNLWVADAASVSATPPVALTKFTAGEVGAPFWSADGSALFFAHGGDLWRVSVGGTGAAPAPVWTTKTGESQIAPSPDRTRVAFVREGDIWVRSLGDGAETRLTATPESEGGPLWSPDGTRIAFSAAKVARHEYAPDYSGAKILYTVTERTPLDIQVAQITHIAQIAQVAPASSGGGGGAIVTVAPSPAVERAVRWLDATHLVFERVSQDTTTREIVIGDAITGEGRVLVREVDDKWWSVPPAAQPGPQPSPDGRWIAFVSDRDGWDRIYIVAAAGGEPVAISPAGREAWRPSWSADGTHIAYDANSPEAPGTRQLYSAAIAAGRASGTPKALTSGRGTNIAATWSPDSRALVYQHTDAQHSADLEVVRDDASHEDATRGTATRDRSIAHPPVPPRRLSDSLPAGFDRAAFVEPELVWYPSSDGQKVPAWLFVPRGLDRSKKHPAIVWIHGDGINQNYDGWHVERNYAVYYSFHQYLVQHGYVVIAPDYRGSIGYGKAWRQGVFLDVGGKDYEDAALSARYLKTLGFVDADRIGVWGLSYGGFFTLQAVTLAPREFRCAVDVAGVADYAMYYEDPWKGAWTYGRMRAPEDNPKAYAAASPLSHVDRIERPLLILHGTADVNVPYLHSVRLADALLKLGKDYEFVTYPGEFHYFTREHVLRDAWHKVERFFDRHLQSPSTSGQSAQ